MASEWTQRESLIASSQMLRKAATMKPTPVTKPMSDVKGAIRKVITFQVTEPDEKPPAKDSEPLKPQAFSKQKLNLPVKETPSPNLSVPTILRGPYVDKERLRTVLNRALGKGQWKAKVSHPLPSAHQARD